MAAIDFGGGQPYTITLDNIEIPYLSKYITNNKMEKKPLWTKQSLNGENEYFQVQIETGNGDEEFYSEPSDTYMCHICNTHVPTMYSKEHNNSERHETLKYIFQEVLRRLSKQINADIIDIDNGDSNIMYFCVTCSKIIKIKNKIKHESSDYHVKMLKDMYVAKEFYKTLQERKEVENERRTDKDRTPESEFVTKSTPNKNDDTTYTFKTCSSSSIDSDDESVDFTVLGSTERVSPKPEDENKAIVNVDFEKLKNFEEYLKEMIKTYELKVNLPTVSGESACLVTPSGNRVNVSSEHFHSYRTLEDRVYCQLCKLWVSLDTRSHDVTENHVRRIFSPINENFARTIDHVTSHCVPCNDVILTDSDHHSINDNHKKNIKEARVTNTGRTYCDDCNIYIDTHNFNVHTKSKKHVDVLMEKHSVSKLDHTENIVYCNTCKIIIHKNDLSDHVNSKGHAAKKNDDSSKAKNKTTKANITNSTKVMNKSTVVDHTSNISSKVNNSSPAIGVVTNPDYCETCKVKVPKGGMKTHVNGKPHKNVLSSLKADSENKLKNQESKVENAVKALSGIKDNKASTSALSKVQSRPSDDTLREYYDQLEFTDLTKTELKCKICYIVIDCVESSITQHMEGKSHVEISTKLKMEEYRKFLIYTNDAKTKFKCAICDLYLSSADRNIIEHMEGRSHKAEEDILIKCHKVKRNQSEYTCDCCNIDMKNYFEHIYGRKHILTYFKKYNFDKKLFRKYIYETNEGGAVAKRIRDLYRNVLKHNGILEKEYGFFCAVCDIQLERIREIDHVLEENHIDKVSKLSTVVDIVEGTIEFLKNHFFS